MGIVQDLAGFFIARFFLGVAESGLFPGVVYYFSMWYQRRERQFRISLFFGAAALAGSFGGILAYVSAYGWSTQVHVRTLVDCFYAGNWAYGRCCLGERLALDLHLGEYLIINSLWFTPECFLNP